ncbi:MAG: endolytic transglycosylase MltG [Thermoleophilia bacterium]
MSPNLQLTRRGRRLLVTFGFLALIAAGGALFLASDYRSESRDDEVEEPGTVRTVVIPEGHTAQDVAQLLERAGIIRSAATFLLEIRLREAAESIQPGTYEFETGQDVATIIALLKEGVPPATFRLTLPEGLSIDQTATRLHDVEGIDADEYGTLAARPADFALPTLGGSKLSVEDLEGLLFPSTYFLEEGTDAKRLIQLQLDTFANKTSGLRWEAAKKLGVTPYEVVVIASMIEKEARVAEERARVAAVIYNRLALDMPLGIDATTRFALKKWTGVLTKSDLEVDSPYNTRREVGLPPGPIASPGLETMEAALAPEDVDFLYYVLIDAEGHHFFTNSYEEFLQAKARAPSQE